MLKLWPFVGGVHLEEPPLEVSQLAVLQPPLPKQLIYPLAMRDGANANPQVKPGERVLKGQVIAAAGRLFPPIHAASSGQVREIALRTLPHPSGLSGECIIIEVDGEDESVELHGIADFTQIEPAVLREKIHTAGIVGLGGAAFPTALKLDPPQQATLDTLVLNGAECEPYIRCDDSLLRHTPHDVLGGAKVLMHVLGVSRCLLAVEDTMQDAISRLENAQGEGDYKGIQIVPVPSIYPMGGERQLIKTLTGREVPAEGIPAQIGVVCFNVGTAAAVHKAIVCGEPLMSRIVTVTGRGVRKPQNLLARIGSPIADLVEFCGGYTDSAYRLIMGGPMMGFSLPSDEPPITKATNCILVAGQGELAAEKPVMPCIRCGACATACPASLLPQQLYWYARAGDLERVMDYHLSACIECGCCDMVCPSHIPLVQSFRSAKSKVVAKAQERLNAEHARLRYESRQERINRENREKAENAKRKKALLAKKLDNQKTP